MDQIWVTTKAALVKTLFHLQSDKQLAAYFDEYVASFFPRQVPDRRGSGP
jgi:hypothetical protein